MLHQYRVSQIELYYNFVTKFHSGFTKFAYALIYIMPQIVTFLEGIKTWLLAPNLGI